MCSYMTPDPSLCANCSIQGHAVCIGIEHFQGYAFCVNCMGQETSQYAAMSDALLRQEWHSSLLRQVSPWKERARNAVGASASIGIAVGGVAATAAGAALAVARGFVQRASSAVSGHGDQAALMPPPPPNPDPSFQRPRSLRRSNSAGDLAIVSGALCPACDLGQKRAHTYTGSCRGLPRSVYFQPKGSIKAIADTLAVQLETASSSTELLTGLKLQPARLSLLVGQSLWHHPHLVQNMRMVLSGNLNDSKLLPSPWKYFAPS